MDVARGHQPLQTAIRELEEELGLKLQLKDFEYLFTVKKQAVLNHGTLHENSFVYVYLVRIERPITDFILQPSEVTAVQWMDIEQLEQGVFRKDPAFSRQDEEYEQLFRLLKTKIR